MSSSIKKNKYYRPTKYINGKEKLISRIIMEQHLGRKLLTEELVHHKDKNPSNNNFKNLQLVTRGEHKKIHFEIGMKTRLKKKYFFNRQNILALYLKYKNTYDVAKYKKCSEITIRRFLIKFLKVKGLSQFRKKKGWSYDKKYI